jgi:hypothetical protein
VELGELYRCTFRSTSRRWYNKLCVYGGEDIINRDDGAKIINHRFFVDGEMRLVDAMLLKYFYLLDN